jgi:mannan endo-1,4-beta-mannosidase
VELHDLTGNRSAPDLLTMAEYYASDEIRPILIDFEPYLLVNIANEWSGNLLAYEPAITLLRESGIHHTLVVDGSGFGQSINSILQAGPTLLDADPEHNLLFSVHMYASFAETPAITSALTRASAVALPLIVGEFGWVHSGRSIDYEFIMSEAERLGVGFLAWSWKGNSGGDEALDISIDWQGEQLSEYGEVVMNAIGASSQPASIFE